MITEKQRRRALARAKWERQQAKRSAAAKRARTMSIIFGAAASVVVILFVGWGVHHLVTDDSTTPSNPNDTFVNTITPLAPTGTQDTRVVVSYSPPTTGASTGTGSTTAVTTSTATTAPVTTTTPATTGATGTNQP